MQQLHTLNDLCPCARVRVWVCLIEDGGGRGGGGGATGGISEGEQ